MALVWIGVAALLAAVLLVLVLGRRQADAAARALSPAALRAAAPEAFQPATAPMVERPAQAPTAGVEARPAARTMAPVQHAPSTAAAPTQLPPSPVPAPTDGRGQSPIASDAPATERALPAALAAFRLIRADDLPAERRTNYAEAFKNIPRPPKLLHHLLSPDFVNASSAAQLVDLIAGEPLLAARILTVVNSPLYALASPMSSIGQAVTYLGLNSVRSLCLQYILIASFKPDSAERKRMVHTAWTASALASELVQQLSQRLGFDDRGSLVSAVVLSFLGRLATIAALSRTALEAVARGSFLDRTVAEQTVLGLGSSQIGRLLMQQWGLPERIVDEACDVDAVLWTPSSQVESEHGARLALCYLCARLGERLADDASAYLSGFDLEQDDSVDLFHLRGYLAHPALARVAPTLRAADLEARLQKVRAAMRG